MDFRADRLRWLDALRVWAFALLMIFHTGMIFNHWPWYIKAAKPSAGLTYVMIVISQFRLPLLFLISGAATWLFLRKNKTSELFKKRMRSILPILLLGFGILSPLQIIVENYFAGQHPEINGLRRIPLSFAFYPNGFISWHHLWFLAYLLAYTGLFYVFSAAQQRFPVRPKRSLVIKSRQMQALLLFFISAFTLNYGSTAVIDTRDVWGSPMGFLRYGVFFATGYFIFSGQLLSILKTTAPYAAIAAAACTAVLFWEFWLPGKLILTPAAIALRGLNAAFWTFAIFAWAARCNFTIGASYNRHILFLYVIHQPLLLGIALYTTHSFSNPLSNFTVTLFVLAGTLWVTNLTRKKMDQR